MPWQQTTCAALGCVRKALGSRSKGWDPSPLRQQWWGHTGGSVLPSRREMHRVQPVQHRTRRMDQGMGDWTYRRGWDSWGRLARERKGSRDLTNVHKLLKGERKENGARHFSVLTRQIRRGNATDWLTLHPIQISENLSPGSGTCQTLEQCFHTGCEFVEIPQTWSLGTFFYSWSCFVQWMHSAISRGPLQPVSFCDPTLSKLSLLLSVGIISHLPFIHYQTNVKLFKPLWYIAFISLKIQLQLLPLIIRTFNCLCYKLIKKHMKESRKNKRKKMFWVYVARFREWSLWSTKV